MLELRLFRQIFQRLQGGRIRVVYWDNSSDEFGQGDLIGTLTLHNQQALKQMMRDLELGFAEGYMDGTIDFSGDLHDLVVLSAVNRDTLPSLANSRIIRGIVRGLTKATTIKEQRADVHHHYDLGNDFFKLFLDPSMTYSCAYYHAKNDSLEKAQAQKVDHVLRKLRLHKDETLLDIGSGWGSLILQAAHDWGVRSHGITMSDEQVKEVDARILAQKLTGRVSVELIDYRQHAELCNKEGRQYDKISSVGMYEHVGRPNLQLFIKDMAALLKPGGLALLHFISKPAEEPAGKFTIKYIFPGGYIPSLRETISHMADNDLRVLDVENLRLHYAYTLDVWAENFEKNLDKVRQIFADREKLGERWGGAIEAEKFIRMWRLYLRGSAAGFRAGSIELHQVLVSKGINNELPLTRDDMYKKNPKSK